MDTTTDTLTVVRAEMEPCRVRLDIEVPAERTQAVYNETARLFNRSARIPGFRPGKAPARLLRNRYGKEIADETKQRLLRAAVEEALKQEGIEPEVQPRVENEEAVTVVQGQPFVFAVTFDVAPTFDMPEYKGLQATRGNTAVEDDSVDEVIDGWLRQRASYDKVERPAAAGDLLKVTYRAAWPEGEEEPPETTRFLLEQEDTWLALREPELLPGTLTTLVGLEGGDEKDVAIRFPEDYAQEALAGKTLDYHFTILEVHASQVPDFDDEVAREMGAESADEVRKIVRANLARERQQQEEQSVRSQILRALMDGMDFPVPPALLRRETHDALRQLYEQEMRGGRTAEDLRERTGELMQRAGEEAEAQLRRYYVLRRIADAEEITIEAAELDEAVENLARMHRVTAKVMVRRLRDSGRLADLMVSLRESKTIHRLVELAEITEPDTADTADTEADA